VLCPSYPIETGRLLLRPFAASDHAALLAIHSRDDVTRYLNWDPRGPEEVTRVLALKVAATALEHEGDTLDLAVVLREDGTLVGDLTLMWRSAVHRQAEVGYVFHADHHGRGLATEATAALLQLGFEELGLHRIYGCLDARNTASARVLEKLGMRREAHILENELVRRGALRHARPRVGGEGGQLAGPGMRQPERCITARGRTESPSGAQTPPR
jgi:RimJ/RimL family protein N-acetyltransferase